MMRGHACMDEYKSCYVINSLLREGGTGVGRHWGHGPPSAKNAPKHVIPVSYTHLTLPTNREV